MKLDPPVPGAAVTREGDQICISGLPSGERTRITLRAGMPGEGGLSLVKDTSLNVAMANRRPRIDFDTRIFVLPRGQTPAIGLTTVNLSGVKLTLARLTERNVVGFVRNPASASRWIPGTPKDRGAERAYRLAGQRRYPDLAGEPYGSHRSADAGRAGCIRSWPFALIARAGDGTPNT